MPKKPMTPPATALHLLIKHLPIAFGTDALLALGNIFSYAIADDLVQEFFIHPGLWLYGPFASGKTTLARLLAACWSPESKIERATLGNSSSNVALTRILHRNPNRPVIFDEYRHRMPDTEALERLLRGAAERSLTMKVTTLHAKKGDFLRTLTTPIVCGENRSRDAATASRYLGIRMVKPLLVSANRRRASWELLKVIHGDLPRVGRWLKTLRGDMRATVIPKTRTMAAHSGRPRQTIAACVAMESLLFAMRAAGIAPTAAFLTKLGTREQFHCEK